MNWHDVIAAVLAGGLAGQLTATFLGYRYAAKREFNNWLRDERYKAFTKLLECVAPFATREEFDTWPDEIRTISQKVYLLYPNGKPPEEITQSIENLFNLSLARAQNKVEDLSSWRKSMRGENRVLREALAELIHTTYG
jgi:hypothetical protein